MPGCLLQRGRSENCTGACIDTKLCVIAEHICEGFDHPDAPSTDITEAARQLRLATVQEYQKRLGYKPSNKQRKAAAAAAEAGSDSGVCSSSNTEGRTKASSSSSLMSSSSSRQQQQQLEADGCSECI